MLHSRFLSKSLGEGKILRRKISNGINIGSEIEFRGRQGPYRKVIRERVMTSATRIRLTLTYAANKVSGPGSLGMTEFCFTRVDTLKKATVEFENFVSVNTAGFSDEIISNT